MIAAENKITNKYQCCNDLNMKTEIFLHDEGYGYGEREIKQVGMTVDEMIEKLKELSGQGYGDRVVFDGQWEPIVDVSYVNHLHYEVPVPQIV